MDTHKIKPILLLRPGLEELDFAISKCSKKSLIPHIAHTVQCKLCISLLQKYGLDLDVVRFGSSSVVIDQTCCLEQIQSC